MCNNDTVLDMTELSVLNFSDSVLVTWVKLVSAVLGKFLSDYILFCHAC